MILEVDDGQLNNCLEQCLQPGSRLVRGQGGTWSPGDVECDSLRRKPGDAHRRHRDDHRGPLHI